MFPTGLVSPAWATKNDWERHRAEITELYRKRKLKEVMEHMARVHDFYATENMYKSRLGSWGLRKNFGETTVKQAIEWLGDGTASSIRDKNIRRKIERYLTRKPDMLQELQGAAGQATLQGLLLRKAPGGCAPVTRLRTLQPSPFTLRAPKQLQLSDEIFRLHSAFLSSLDGGFVGGMAKPPEQDEQMLKFVIGFHVAHNLITENHNRAGFACLSYSFEQLSRMLVPQGHPMTLLYVLNVAFEVSAEYRFPEILGMLFRYLRDLAHIRLGPLHPATEISRRFGILEHGQHAAVLGLMRRLQADSVARSVWQAKGEMAFSVYDKVVEVWSTDRTNLVAGLEQLLSDWELARKPYLMTMLVRMRAAVVRMDNGMEIEMIAEILKDEYPTEWLFQLREHGRLSLSLQCYRVRGYMLIEEGKFESARGMFRAGKLLADITWREGNVISVGFEEDLRGVPG